MRNQIAAANWKMNLTLPAAEILMDDLLGMDRSLHNNQLAIFAVPFPYLITIREKIKGIQNIFVAAQNCSANKSGAFTGEVSVEMLQSIGVKYVIIGHSERRELYFESNSILAEKLNRALEAGIIPIFCCGESLDIREAGTHNSYIETQLKEGLFHLNKEQMEGFIIAYEPVWAIGTGKTASSAQAQEMHAHIRSVIAFQYGKNVSDTVSILYGGSVKGTNAGEIFAQPDVDGGLVGGASLVAKEFATIIKSLKKE